MAAKEQEQKLLHTFYACRKLYNYNRFL
ncbi:helix-turn-helix domain-containing protein [Paenibacillus aceris]|nr:helix-turn-helix domain-containing protein [Paenibacillus aceris]